MVSVSGSIVMTPYGSAPEPSTACEWRGSGSLPFALAGWWRGAFSWAKMVGPRYQAQLLARQLF